MRNIFASVDIDFSLESGWNPADREPIRASVATLVFPTKSPLNWARARWPEGSLFGHWRSGAAFAQVSCRSTRRGVREHPAPSGALRQVKKIVISLWKFHGQGAPSTIRCIKTTSTDSTTPSTPRVREHPAPSGTLRQRLEGELETRAVLVREHPAPSGALRLDNIFSDMISNRLLSGSTQHHQVH